jgi:hypothetical protein
MASRFSPPEVGQQAILGAEDLPRLSAPPWQVMPAGAIPFIVQGRGSITGQDLANTSIVICQAQAPQFYVGVVRELAYQINDIVQTSDVEFAFRVNESPVLDATIKVFPKTASHDLIEFDPNVTMIRIAEFGTIDVRVTVFAGDINTYLVGAVVRGWWYPEHFDRAYAT